MRIFSWNVNGIRAVEKKGTLASFIEKHYPDVICFQEIKASDAGMDLLYPQYNKYWNPARKPGYSGTAIWTKTEPVSIAHGMPDALARKYGLEGDSYGDPNEEGRVLVAEFADFFVVTVYTPNSKGDLSRLPLRHKQWDPAFLEYMRQLEGNKPVIFCGDLNVAHKEIDLANPKQNVGKHGFTDEEREGIDKMIAAGFVDTLREFNKDPGQYTWWTHWANARTRNIGWRIDYVFISQALRQQLAGAAAHPDAMGSDHCPVSIELKL